LGIKRVISGTAVGRLDYVPEMPGQPKEPERLVHAAPDPDVDRAALRELRDSGSPQTKELAERLLGSEAWRNLPLGKLLLGLPLINAPNFSIRLSVRAANPLLKADLVTLRALATKTPVDLLALPGLGTRTVEEVLATAVSEWAAAYLGEDSKDQETSPNPSTHASDALNPRELQRRLSDALDEIEGATGFEAFRRRKLDPGESPSQSEVAAALGLKPEQVPHYERAIREKIARKMRDEDSGLSSAVAALKEGVGVLARPSDLERALAAIDPFERAMPKDAPQRRALLLLLTGLRVTDDWIVDVEIEEIVDALFKGLTDGRPASLDVIDRQLGRLGVRQDLRLPWVVTRSGYRVVKQKLVRIDGG
jgi:Bacterial RNA polymerase, alpha chain C terminal domain